MAPYLSASFVGAWPRSLMRRPTRHLEPSIGELVGADEEWCRRVGRMEDQDKSPQPRVRGDHQLRWRDSRGRRRYFAGGPRVRRATNVRSTSQGRPRKHREQTGILDIRSEQGQIGRAPKPECLGIRNSATNTLITVWFQVRVLVGPPISPWPSLPSCCCWEVLVASLLQPRITGIQTGWAFQRSTGATSMDFVP